MHGPAFERAIAKLAGGDAQVRTPNRHASERFPNRRGQRQHRLAHASTPWVRASAKGARKHSDPAGSQLIVLSED
jgi:hypothetical protein